MTKQRCGQGDAAFWQATLDSLVAHVAVLDEKGEILAVNAAWRRFASENAMEDPDACIGRNYLQVCESVLGADGEEGPTAAMRIRRVLSGEKEHQAFAYPCHGPKKKRWFMFRVTRFAGDGPARVVVQHENITAMRAAELRAKGLAERLSRSEDLEKRAGGVLESIATNQLLESVLRKIVALVERRCGGLAAILLERDGSLQVADSARLSSALRNRLVELCRAQLHGECGLREIRVCTVAEGEWEDDSSADLPGRSLALAPLRDKKGAALGWLAFWGGAAEPDEDERTVLRRAAHLAVVAVQHRRMQDQLSLQARHDPITELPNRLFVSELLEEAARKSKRDGGSFALLAVQLQQFAQVVDTYGHAAGDSLLKVVGEQLRHALPAEQTLARLSGGTFVVLSTGPVSRSEVVARAESVLQVFEKPFPFLDSTRKLAVDIGIGIFPEDGGVAGELLRDITAAMRRSSKPGHSSIQSFAFETARQLGRYSEIAKHLESAIENDEFQLVYQPQVRLGREVVAMEALLRWSNPHLGPVSPGAFIPVAQESGQIVAIDSWVLRRAFEQARLWQRMGCRVRTAINVSAARFTSTEFVDSIRLLLRQTGVDPGRIELEITEGTMMQNPDVAAAQITELRGLGIRTAIDDFGAGYSSLSYLRLLPVHCVKIDRSFLEDLHASSNSLAILGAIIELSHQLGLEVVIEGVETAEQLQLLAPLHPDLLQGFFFHRPMPPRNAESLLMASVRSPEALAPSPERWSQA